MVRHAALFLALLAPLTAASPVKIVLIAGRPSHGPGEHEFNNGILLLDRCLRQNAGVETAVVKGGWPNDEAVLEGAKEIVFYLDGGASHPLLEGKRLEKIGSMVSKGLGIACLHYAVEIPAGGGGLRFLDWLGGYYDISLSNNAINDTLVTQASPRHPISRGWKSFQLKDEWYYNIVFNTDDPRITPILTAMLPANDPRKQTVSWVVKRKDGGRGFGFDGAHFNSNWGNEDFRKLVVNGILWTAGVEVPSHGAIVKISPEDLTAHLDPKPPKKAKVN